MEAIRGEMGWSSNKERIVKGKMCFMKKIERMSRERWAKRIIIENRTLSSWKREIGRWKRRENLENDWDTLGINDIKKKDS